MSSHTRQGSVHTGSSFDDFLDAEGLRNEVEGAAIKRVLAWQLEQEMARQQKTKTAMAIELRTSRSQLDRLLDPANTAVSLDTIARAAQVLGKRLVFEIRDPRPVAAEAAFRAGRIDAGQKAEVAGRGRNGRGRRSVKGPVAGARSASER